MGNPRKQIGSKGRKLNYIVTPKQKNFLRNSPPSVPKLSPEITQNQWDSKFGQISPNSETIQTPGFFAQAGQRSPNGNPGYQGFQDYRQSPEFYQNSEHWNYQNTIYRRSPDYYPNQFQPTIGFSLEYFPQINWENFNQNKTSKKFEEFEKIWNTEEEPKNPKSQSTPKKIHHMKPYEKVNEEDEIKVDCEALAKELIDIILQQAKNCK